MNNKITKRPRDKINGKRSKKRLKKDEDYSNFFKQFNTFEDFIENNILWLNSKTDITCFIPMREYVNKMFFKYDLLSIQLMGESIIELNKLGFLTDGSQVGYDSKGCH